MFWTTSFESRSFRCHWLFTVTFINSPSLFKCHASIALVILDSNPLKPSLKFLLSMPCTHGLISSYLKPNLRCLFFIDCYKKKCFALSKSHLNSKRFPICFLLIILPLEGYLVHVCTTQLFCIHGQKNLRSIPDRPLHSRYFWNSDYFAIVLIFTGHFTVSNVI